MTPIEMTIPQMMAEKRRCEVAMLEALRTFQEKTGLNVAGLDFHESAIIGKRQFQVIDLSIVVELP